MTSRFIPQGAVSLMGAVRWRDWAAGSEGSGARIAGPGASGGWRAARLVASLVLVLGASVTFASGAASAAIFHPFVSSVNGTPAGSFAEPAGLALDESGSASAWDLYVADGTDPVVDKFSTGASPSYVCQITGAGSSSASSTECSKAAAGAPGGTLSNATGVAVNPANGNVWVATLSLGVVDEFDPAGNYVTQVTGLNFPSGVAVDHLTGDVYIADGGAGVVYKFDPSTSTLTTFASVANVDQVAVDNSSGPSAGDVYVSAFGSSDVQKFDSSGDPLATLTGPPGGSFSSPNGIAVDTATGDVYVADSGAGVVDQFDQAGNFLGQITGSETTAASMSPQGVAVSAATGDVHVSDDTNHVVDVFGPGVVIPDVTTGTPSPIGPTSATLQATVNADATTVSNCHFDYVDDADYKPSAPNPYAAGQTAACVPTPSGSSPTSVSASVTGLTAGTTYHVRVEATNSNSTNYGQDVTFSTPPPPSIDSATATNLTTTSADLNAQINPNGYDTTYHFQYGTSTTYGTSIPIPDADIGSGTSDVPVTQQITGLAQNTEYHWRVVATSANGTTTSVDHTFIYDTTGQGLPDERAYEMVTPVNKNGALFPFVLGGGPGGLPGDFSLDGSQVILSSIQCIAGSGSCTAARGVLGTPVEFTRTSSGWQATPLAPSASIAADSTVMRVSADSGTALFSWPTAPGGEDDFYARQTDGTFVDIGPVYPPADGANGAANSYGLAGTADLSHLVFSANTGQTWPFDSTLSGAPSEYEYAGTGNSQPVLLGVSGGAGSTDLISTCGTALGSSQQSQLGSMSADGSTVYFTALACSSGSGANASTPVPADTLYARIDESQTVLISGRSPSGCTTSACQSSPPSGANFDGASSDGSKAFFTSAQELTDQATQGSNNLYLYDFDNPPGQNLIDVSGGDTSGLGPEVQGALGISPDGSHVYFVAKGVLTGAANAQGRAPRPALTTCMCTSATPRTRTARRRSSRR